MDHVAVRPTSELFSFILSQENTNRSGKCDRCIDNMEVALDLAEMYPDNCDQYFDQMLEDITEKAANNKCTDCTFLRIQHAK